MQPESAYSACVMNSMIMSLHFLVLKYSCCQHSVNIVIRSHLSPAAHAKQATRWGGGVWSTEIIVVTVQPGFTLPLLQKRLHCRVFVSCFFQFQLTLHFGLTWLSIARQGKARETQHNSWFNLKRTSSRLSCQCFLSLDEYQEQFFIACTIQCYFLTHPISTWNCTSDVSEVPHM